jgi:hypothetical protein
VKVNLVSLVNQVNFTSTKNQENFKRCCNFFEKEAVLPSILKNNIKTMKSIIIYAAIAIIFLSQSASAQTGTSVKKGKTSEVLLAVQTAAVAEKYVTLMDKMQRETEELIMNITPAPLLSLASKIHEKLDGVKEKNSKKESKSKSCQSTCNL